MAKAGLTKSNAGPRRANPAITEIAIEMSARGYSAAEIAHRVLNLLKKKISRVSIWRAYVQPNKDEIERRRADLIENYKERIPIAKKEVRLAQLADSLQQARTGVEQVRIDKQGREHRIFAPDHWLADRIMRTIQAEIGEDTTKLADAMKHSGTKVNVNVIGDYHNLPVEEQDRRAQEWSRVISSARLGGAMGRG